MKHNRTCWSVAGANNLAALLALHHMGNLWRVPRGWTASGHPEGGGYTVTMPFSAKQVSKQGDDTYVLPHTLSSGEVHPAVKHCLSAFAPLSQMHICV